MSAAPLVRGFVLALSLCAGASSARAAGGLFVGEGQTVEARSVVAALDLTVDPPTVSVAVELRTDAARVAWVLPLPDGASTASAAPDALDARVPALEVALPRPDPCVIAAPPTTGGCACGEDPPAPAAPPVDVPPPEARPPATVYGRATGTATTARRLVARAAQVAEALVADGFEVTDAQRAAIDATLTNRRDVWVQTFDVPGGWTARTIRLPVATWTLPDGAARALPLRLLAPTASPVLDLRVVLDAAGPQLSENWVPVAPRDEELLHDADGAVSYPAWLARAGADANGRLFAIEAVEEVDGLVRTAYYARPYAHRLERDPVFRAHPQEGLRVEPSLDLTAQPSLQICEAVVEARRPLACAFTYCGERSECFSIDEAAACACPDDAAATVVDTPGGAPTITCAPPPATAAPCDRSGCVAGTCSADGPRTWCACPPGSAAIAAAGGVACRPLSAAAVPLGPGGGLEARGDVTAQAGATVFVVGALALLLVGRPRAGRRV